MDLRIAFIGRAFGTSLHRVRALQRLGNMVRIIDPRRYLESSLWVSRWLYHAGGAGVGLLINKRLVAEVEESYPELIWVDQGEFLGKGVIKNLRGVGVPIVNYTIDDPFGGRDGLRFRHYLSALPYYDLLAVVRESNIEEARQRGARQVIRVYRSADEHAHRARPLTEEQRRHYASEVTFIGTWMPERGPFMAELVQRGVSLSIWGDRWHKAREWSVLKPHWRGPGIYDDEHYAAAVLSAKICLGLLSKGNRDLHTTRSLEIPSLGGLLCAERTKEHQLLYNEGTEAIFFNSAEECANTCHGLLADDTLRATIARHGQERALRNNLFNEPVMASIVEAAMKIKHLEK
ncbi:MAG: CgeB family protein [Gammaproteobacteria bacterium]